MRYLSLPDEDTGQIAVVGMAGRFPGAANLEEFWANLVQGIESIRTLSREELLASGEDLDRISDPAYVPRHGVLEEAVCFDADLFGYSSRDAALIDPQQRVFLECAWEALEHAGYDPRRQAGVTAVYAGCSISSYALALWSRRDLSSSSLDEYLLSVSTAPDNLADRVAYKLGLTGPSVTVLTGCSSSLVAVHQACQALLGGECDVALAGGAVVSVPPRGYRYQEGGVMSPDGHIRAFDSAARGIVGGDGVGIVVLKRLADALRHGDYVHAVVLGSAVNNDGADRVGYTAPSVNGQAQVIRAAQILAGVEPETIGYVETHGTGTPVGDPIEIAALTKAFQATTSKRGFCAIASVKTNIGHTGAAAGVAGLIKTILALEHGVLPPSLHFHDPNPEIDFAGSPFYVNTEARKWTTDRAPRRAAVSSFGMGGTNAHVVLEGPPDPAAPSPAPPWQLLVLSANSAAALETATCNLAAHLRRRPESSLADVAFTLQVGRHALPYRRFAVCADADDALRVLKGEERTRLATSTGPPRERPVVFMFPGQGAQHVGMAAHLYEAVPEFRKHVDECCELLAPRLGLDLRELLYAPPERADTAAALLDQTALAQPALFLIEYALAQLLMQWGLKPAAMIGHSVGEYVAACLSGVFDLDEALAVVADRGRMMQKMATGAMLSVPLPETEVRHLLGDDLSIAAANGPSRCVVSGPIDLIEALRADFKGRGTITRLLHTSHAFHSAAMQPIMAAFEERVRSVHRRPPSILYVSNVTGAWITPEEAVDPAYWAQQLRATVRFGDGLATVLAGSEHVLVEVGPGRTLTTLARQHPAADAGLVMGCLPHRGGGSDLASALETVGRLWLLGTPIAWSGLIGNQRRLRLPLPTYPFERLRHVVTAPLHAANPAASQEPTAPQEPAVPKDEIEQSIAVHFAEVLGTDRVRVTDNLFELGGDSLTAAQLHARVRETFRVEVPLEAIFDHPTTSGLARVVEELLSGGRLP